MIEDIERALEDRTLTPVVGPALTPLPGIKRLLLRATDELEAQGQPHENLRDFVDQGRWLEAIEEAKGGLKSHWPKLLKAAFTPLSSTVPRASYAPLELVWQLGSSLIVTTASDRCLSWACPEPWSDTLHECQLRPGFESRRERATIWYLNGRPDQAQGITLQPEVARAIAAETTRADYEISLLALRDLMLRRTLLLLGYDKVDGPPLAQLEWIAEHIEQPPMHYLLVEDGDHDHLKAATARLGFIQVLSAANYGGDVHATLASLVQRAKKGPVSNNEPT